VIEVSGGSGRSWWRILPVTLVIGYIFFLSSQPGNSFSLPEVVNIDKLLHSLLVSMC